jgi:hypothetical protein
MTSCGKLSRLHWQQPEEQIADRHGLALSRTSYQCVRAFKPVRPLDLHLPILIGARPNNRYPPVSRPAAQNMLNDRLDFRPDRNIADIMQFNQNSHFMHILQRLCLAKI